MSLLSVPMTGAALPGAASDTPPWPVRVTRSLLGYGVIAGPFFVDARTTITFLAPPAPGRPPSSKPTFEEAARAPAY